MRENEENRIALMPFHGVLRAIGECRFVLEKTERRDYLETTLSERVGGGGGRIEQGLEQLLPQETSLGVGIPLRGSETGRTRYLTKM